MPPPADEAANGEKQPEIERQEGEAKTLKVLIPDTWKKGAKIVVPHPWHRGATISITVPDYATTGGTPGIEIPACRAPS